MTYSIIARDPDTGQMGVASQSQAFAVGSSVPWAMSGHGVIATQSMGEPMYGELGLDALRAGLTAEEALRALRTVDPQPELRQVAMLDSHGNLDVYTGAACIAAAGHHVGDGCAALANMVASETVWEAMTEAYEAAPGTVAERLLAALHAAEAEGGDFRGRRSAAILVVRAERTGRPWRDQLVDLRVDDHDDPLAQLNRHVTLSLHYHRTVEAFGLALAGDQAGALDALEDLPDPNAAANPDIALWSAVVLGLAGREADAAGLFRDLGTHAPQFLEAAYRFRDAELLPSFDELDHLLPPRPSA